MSTKQYFNNVSLDHPVYSHAIIIAMKLLNKIQGCLVKLTDNLQGINNGFEESIGSIVDSFISDTLQKLKAQLKMARQKGGKMNKNSMETK